jgi:hypothetical protein
MRLILLQIIVQSVSSTLHWLGVYVGIRASADQSRQRWWIIGSAVVFAAWLIGIALLASSDVLSPQRVPVTLFATLAVGYLVLLSRTVRAIIANIPQHWLIGIQTFRILGGVFLIRYFDGELPGIFAIPAGMGDVITGVLAPLVAYWWFVSKPYARAAAIAWNLFGMADLIDAVAIGALTRGAGGGIVFPIILIPLYGVPRAFLIHSYSLVGLLKRTSQPPKPGESLHYGIAAS